MKNFVFLLFASIFLLSCQPPHGKEIIDNRPMVFEQDIDSCRRQPELYWCTIPNNHLKVPNPENK